MFIPLFQNEPYSLRLLNLVGSFSTVHIFSGSPVVAVAIVRVYEKQSPIFVPHRWLTFQLKYWRILRLIDLLQNKNCITVS